MAQILEFKEKKAEMTDEMLSVDQWDGECWKTIFDQVFIPASKECGISPWDCLANFVRGLLMGEEGSKT